MIYLQHKTMVHSMADNENEYDHIVIGGGSSGCVAAARLVSEGGRRVLLLEAGIQRINDETTLSIQSVLVILGFF